MAFLNVEIKASCKNPGAIRTYLQNSNAVFKGIDVQTDTYFAVTKGRLKLREGNIENNLIYYERNDQAGPKQSSFQLVKINDPEGLKEVLTQSIGINVIVHKRREIYFINNVKFHLDEVPGLGSFVEIEASNLYADLTAEELRKQCDFYMAAFEIQSSDLVSHSYSDLLL